MTRKLPPGKDTAMSLAALHEFVRRVSPALVAIGLLSGLATPAAEAAEPTPERRLLYVAVPGIRDYLEYGGHGLLVFDIDQGHRFVRRIPTQGLAENGKPLNVKGVCANAGTARIYVSTTQTLTCLDLATDKVLWERAYEGGCDRMAISPDGKIIYLPSFEQDHWHVVDALTGEVLATIVTKSGAHNTIYGPDGKFAYMAGLRSPRLSVAETAQHTVARTVGPFSAPIRPYTINGSQTLCLVNVNGLLGFEIGDLTTGQVLHRVEVQGFKQGPVKRHGCPSHGIALTPDEKEIWLTDGANGRLHLFDATTMPPKQLQSIELRDQPGWITFGIDGRYAYPSTGEVIDVATRKIVAGLTDERGAEVQSEKLLEIDFRGDRPCRAGNQFGIGQVARSRK
jgi:DNA-binding beta-propeller fold protein YncE